MLNKDSTTTNAWLRPVALPAASERLDVAVRNTTRRGRETDAVNQARMVALIREVTSPASGNTVSTAMFAR
jgi:hypothetical protein